MNVCTHVHWAVAGVSEVLGSQGYTASPCQEAKHVPLTPHCPAAPLQPIHLAPEPVACLAVDVSASLVNLMPQGQFPGFSKQAKMTSPGRPWPQKFPRPII